MCGKAKCVKRKKSTTEVEEQQKKLLLHTRFGFPKQKKGKTVQKLLFQTVVPLGHFDFLFKKLLWRWRSLLRVLSLLKKEKKWFKHLWGKHTVGKKKLFLFSLSWSYRISMTFLLCFFSTLSILMQKNTASCIWSTPDFFFKLCLKKYVEKWIWVKGKKSKFCFVFFVSLV